MLIARPRRMGAVLLLVFLPVMASVGFMCGVMQNDSSHGGVIAGLAFIVLAIGLFVGLLNLVRHWETDDIRDR